MPTPAPSRVPDLADHRSEAASAAAEYNPAMIRGAHTIVYSADADADRAFFGDVLGFPSVDAGQGWLIFALPPAELAAHPAEESGRHELYLMCDDIESTVAELEGKGVEFTRPVSDQGWGLFTSLKLPGGGELGLYEPRHPIPHDI